MTLIYRIVLEPDDNDTLLTTCPSVPEMVTFGETREDALYWAVKALEEVFAGRMSDGKDIPDSDTPRTTGEGEAFVEMPALTSTKVMLYRSCRAAGVTRAELARRLDWHREQVDRLFRLDHKSRLDQLEAAFAAIGRRLDITDRAAA